MCSLSSLVIALLVRCQDCFLRNVAMSILTRFCGTQRLVDQTRNNPNMDITCKASSALLDGETLRLLLIHILISIQALCVLLHTYASEKRL